MIFLRKKWMSFSNRDYSRNIIPFSIKVTCMDMYTTIHSRHSRTRGGVVSGTRKTRLIRMQTYWKSQGSFPLTGGGESGKNGARREYRNGKLLRFEKFKYVVLQKKKDSFFSSLCIASTESRISSWALKKGKNNADRDIAIFWKKEKRNYHHQHRGW